MEFKEILAARLGGIGDIVIITPALRALRKRYPDAHITLICESPAADLFQNCDWVDEVIEDTELFRCQKYIRFLTPNFIHRLWKVWRAIRSRKRDLMIEFHSLYNISSIFKPSMIAIASGAKVKVGCDTFKRGFFLSHKLPDWRDEEKHHIIRYRDLLALIEVPCENLRSEVVLSSENRSAAAEIRKELGISSELPVTGIFLGANPKQLIKQYFPDRFAEIAASIVKECRHQVLVFAGPEEKSLVEEFLQASESNSSIHVLTDNHPLMDIAALISSCDYFISADTGIMHLAIAVKTPTLGIFGPGDWHTYGTYPPGHEFIFVRAPVPCWPCREPECPRRDCMKEVTPKMVLAKYDELVELYPLS